MGACSSCCKSDESPEREPLLPKSGPRNRDETAARYTDKIADVAGALEAGRLPSQAQIDHVFRSLLNSDLLKVESANAHLPPPHRKELVTIVDDVKEVVAAMLEVGGEKNGLSASFLHSAPSSQEDVADDKFQDLLFTSKRVSAKSAKASVAVDVTGGPSSVPQELREAGKGPLPPAFMSQLIPINSRALALRPGGTGRRRRARRSCQKPRPVNDILLDLSIHPKGHLHFYESHPRSEYCSRR